MKIKVNKHKLNIYYRGSPWGSRTQQHTYCLRYAHSHHIESHLGKKQPQAKIAIAFLFGQLHFNNVTSHALFYGGHLVMRSKRCAVQNQGITLRDRGSVKSISQQCLRRLPASLQSAFVAHRALSAKLAIIISYPTSTSGIIVLLKMPTKYREFFLNLFVKTTDLTVGCKVGCLQRFRP